MQLREKERPEISLANNSIHGHLCVTALLKDSILFMGKANVVQCGSGTPTEV